MPLLFGPRRRAPYQNLIAVNLLIVQFWCELAIFCLDFDLVLVEITEFIAVFVFNLLF
jgi:hypothetical protein